MSNIIELTPRHRAFDVRKKLHDAAKEMSENYMILADLLYEARENEYYKQWGYASFHDFAEKELDIKSRKAGFLAGIARTVHQLGIPWEDVQGIGWRKLGQVYPVMNQNNYQEMIEMAQENSLTELTNKVKAKREGKEEVAYKRMVLQLTEEEYSIVQAAIEEAMKEEGVNGKSRAFVYIAYNWFMSR